MLLHPIKDLDDPEVAEVRAKAHGINKEIDKAAEEAARMRAKAKEAAIKANVIAIADAANAENDQVP